MQKLRGHEFDVALNGELGISDPFSLYTGVGGSFRSNIHELNYGGAVRWRFGGAPRADLAMGAAAPAPVAEPPLTTPATPATPSIRGLW
ncbi:hypothetical protein KBY82_14335 [Cyanobium sp. AMD-g]|uniref:hypothetical protein n=1 Tax=Cyanobium sp. AMD-g TaxID=2823699 RepID=UPI0020CC3EFB|nr:hypothetical protein [Cyanobium sp. AMD-g]MCP9931957.1 hypothetical protein [Cyanobium sp. AMD-g]